MLSFEQLQEQLSGLVPALREGLAGAGSLAALESLRVDYLGRKGRLAALMSRLPDLAAAERPAFGQAANKAKRDLTELLEKSKALLEKSGEASRLARFDPGVPGRMPWRGSLHPVTLAMEDVCRVFTDMGYEVADGPEVDTDFHCFEALNMPPDHPARDMQDTLYIREKVVLRTHTSTMQVRTMLARKPPVAVIAPGKVYRRDSDVTHTPMFHQIEGLLVDRKVTMTDLRGTLTAFLRALFGGNTRVRFRPSFFPFTEPSVEADMSCTACGGGGRAGDGPCRICKGTGWLEILGSGRVDPAVFEAVGYDPEQVTGFAFGVGVERIAMLRHGLPDLRMNFENDARFLGQFTV
jgi:phenylalanyl-tRNA synthetase alpha chain